MKRTPIKRVNRKRRAKRHVDAFGSKADYIRSLPCDVCHEYGCDPHHIPSRAAGGTSKDLIPLCRPHHTEFHTLGEQSFAAKNGKDLRARTAMYEAGFHESPQPLGF